MSSVSFSNDTPQNVGYLLHILKMYGLIEGRKKVMYEIDYKWKGRAYQGYETCEYEIDCEDKEIIKTIFENEMAEQGMPAYVINIRKVQTDNV